MSERIVAAAAGTDLPHPSEAAERFDEWLNGPTAVPAPATFDDILRDTLGLARAG